MPEIEKLLIEVSAIRQRYEHLAKVTGENFNVFRILGLQTSEVRLHSAFLAELLNPKGSHGQGELFLSLFVNQENIKRAIEQSNVHLELKSTKVFVEYHTGKISDDGQQGGRIDILLEDANKQHIIIENKIYATDQHKQLTRYNNFDPKAALFYLNLSGEVSSDFEKTSAKDLTRGTNYEIISYQNEILEWLEACMKEATTLPLIRETIHQYINLIKRLTNQNMSTNSQNEIIELLSKSQNIEAAFLIADSINQIKHKLMPELKNTIEEIAKQKGLIMIFNCDHFGRYTGFKFYKESWRYIKIGFDFDKANLNSLLYGIIWKTNDKPKELADAIKIKFGGKQSEGWPFYKEMEHPYRDWGFSSAPWIGISNGELKQKIESVIDYLLENLNGLEL